MARQLRFILLAALIALSGAGAGAAPAPAPESGLATGKRPRAIAADYLQRRAGQPIVLVGAGDIALCRYGQGDYAEATARLIEALPEALVFTAGDNAYPDGTWAEFNDCYAKSWGRPGIKARTLPAPGNHDYGSSREPHEAGAYFRYFGAAAANPDTERKGYYSLDLRDWHIVSLNSDIEMRLAHGRDLTPAAHVAMVDEVARQRAWLAADLAAARGRGAQCILGIWHHPRYTSALRGDNPEMAKLWEILSAAGADLVLAGHEHIYETFGPRDRGGKPDPAGMREIVVGTGGAGGGSIWTAALFHFGVLKLTLGAGKYAWEFLPVPKDSLRGQGSASCNSKDAA